MDKLLKPLLKSEGKALTLPNPMVFNVVLKSRHGQWVRSSGVGSWPACNRASASLGRNATVAHQAGTPGFTSHHLPSWHPHAMRPCGPWPTSTHQGNLIPLGLEFLFERPPSSHGCWIIVTCTLRVSAAMDRLASSDAIATMMCWRDQGRSSYGAFLPKHLGTMPLIDRNLGI